MRVGACARAVSSVSVFPWGGGCVGGACNVRVCWRARWGSAVPRIRPVRGALRDTGSGLETLAAWFAFQMSTRSTGSMETTPDPAVSLRVLASTTLDLLRVVSRLDRRLRRHARAAAEHRAEEALRRARRVSRRSGAALLRERLARSYRNPRGEASFWHYASRAMRGIEPETLDALVRTGEVVRCGSLIALDALVTPAAPGATPEAVPEA